MAKGGAFDDMIQTVLYVCFAVYLAMGLALLIMGIIYMGDQGAAGWTGGGLCAIGGFMLILGGLGIYSNYEQIWVLLAVVELVSIALFLILTAIIVIAIIFAMGYTDPVGDLINESWSDIANNEALSYNTDPKSVCFRYVPECETYAETYDAITSGATNGCHRVSAGEFTDESRAQFFADVFMSKYKYTGKGGSNSLDRDERAMCFFPESVATSVCSFYQPLSKAESSAPYTARYGQSDAATTVSKNCGPKWPQAVSVSYCKYTNDGGPQCVPVEHWTGCAGQPIEQECKTCNLKCKDYITREARAGTEAVAFFVIATVCFCVIAVIWNNFLTRGDNDEFDGVFSILGYVINGAVLLVGLTMVVLCIIRLVQSDGYTSLLLGIMFLGLFLLVAGGLAVGGLYGSNPMLINIATLFLAIFGYIMLILGIGLAVCTGFVMDEAQTQYDQNYHKIREAVEKFDATFCQLNNGDCEKITVFGSTTVPVMYKKGTTEISGTATHDPKLLWDHQYLTMQAEATWMLKTYAAEADIQACASHKVCVACGGLISGHNAEQLESSKARSLLGRPAIGTRAPLAYLGGGTVFTRGSSAHDGANSKGKPRERGAGGTADATKDTYVDWKGNGGAFHDGVDILNVIKTIRKYEGKENRLKQNGFCSVNPNAERFFGWTVDKFDEGFGYLTGCSGKVANQDYGCKLADIANVDASGNPSCAPDAALGEKCEMGWVFKDAFESAETLQNSGYVYQTGTQGNTGWTNTKWDGMTKAQKEAFSSGRTRSSELLDADAVARNTFDRQQNFATRTVSTANSKLDSHPTGYTNEEYDAALGTVKFHTVTASQPEVHAGEPWPVQAVAGDASNGVKIGVFGRDSTKKAAGNAYTTKIATCPTGCKKVYKSFGGLVAGAPTCHEASRQDDGSVQNDAQPENCQAAKGCVLVRRITAGTADKLTDSSTLGSDQVGDKTMLQFRATSAGAAGNANLHKSDTTSYFVGKDSGDKVTRAEASTVKDPAVTKGTFKGWLGVDGPERRAELAAYMINVTYAWRNRTAFSSTFEGGEVAAMTGKCEAALSEWSETKECTDYKGEIKANKLSMYRDLEGCAKCASINFATPTSGEEKAQCIKAMYAKARPAMCSSLANKVTCRAKFTVTKAVLDAAHADCRPTTGATCATTCTKHAKVTAPAPAPAPTTAETNTQTIKAACRLFTAFRMKMPATFCQFTDEACKAKLKQKTKDDLKWVGIFGGIFCGVFLCILYFGYRGVIVYMTDDDDDDDE